MNGLKKHKLTAAIGVSLGVMAAPPTFADLNSGLVAHYKFEGNATDSSGNENHGTEHGGLNYTAGKIGQSAQFDGVDDYIQINPQSDMSSVGDFTVVTWVYLEGWKSQTAGPHLDRQYIFDGHTNSSTTRDDFYRPGFGLVYDRGGDDGEIHNFIMFDNDYTEQNTRVSVSGAWHQLLLMRKGTDDFTYFDGELLPATYARNQPSDQPLNMAHNWFIGTFSGNNPYYNNGTFNYSFFGLIDELRIYNRAITGCEIESLYSGKNECKPNLVELANFTVTPNQDGIRLEWETTSELNTAGFYVWRGELLTGGGCTYNPLDYGAVIQLDFDNAKGDLLSGATYSRTDSSITSGTAYCYLLEDVEFDGDSQFHWGFMKSATAK